MEGWDSVLLLVVVVVVVMVTSGKVSGQTTGNVSGCSHGVARDHLHFFVVLDFRRFGGTRSGKNEFVFEPARPTRSFKQ